MCDKSFEQIVDLTDGSNDGSNDGQMNQMIENLKITLTDSNDSDSDEGKSYGSHLKDSMDRFGDDFIEVILQYLSFNDKVMYEEVCKQWQRVIYNKQTILKLNRRETEGENTLNKLLKPIVIKDFLTGYADRSGLKTIKNQSFESVLKKSKFINSIQIECFSDGEDLELIGKYCPYLKSLQCMPLGFTEDNLQEFGLKYGNRLKYIRIFQSCCCHVLIETLFSYCNNLLELSTDDNKHFVKEDPKFLPKLQVLKNLSLSTEGFSKLQVIVDKYHKTLKEIELYLFLTPDQTITALSLISQLKNVQILKLHLGLNSSDGGFTTIDQSIQQISKSCSKIKDLFLGIFDSNLVTNQFFFSVGKFKALKRINLRLYGIERPFEGSVNCFESNDLRHLFIQIKEINDSFFEDIDLFLPNLKSFVIESEAKLTNKTIFSLSKLKDLRKILFALISIDHTFPAYTDITDESICGLLDSCQNIEAIKFAADLNITHKTIDKLISTALKNPQKELHFRYESPNHYNGMNGEVLAQIDMNNYIDSMPQNLKINGALGLFDLHD